MARQVNEKTARELLNDPVEKVICKMAVPTIIAQLITVIYNLTDTLFVSRLGTSATAAVGVNSTIETTITMVGMFIASGAASYIARLLGAKKKEHGDQVFSTSFFMAFIIGIIFAVFGLIFIKPLVDIFGADENCRTYAIQYGTYIFIASPFMIISYLLNQCLRSEGSPTFAMIGIGLGGILNCFLDPIFIFSLGLGVKGASIATAISKVISCLILLYPYVLKKSKISLSIKYFKLKAEDVKEVSAIGSTSLLRTGCNVLASTLMNRAASGVSTAMLAAISVSNRVMLFPFNIILGFGQGYSPVVGYNWGAERYDRTEQSLSFAMKVSIIGGIIMGVIGFVFSRQIIGVFNSQADAEVMANGMLCIRFQSIVLPMHAFLSIINMCYAGIGKAKQALLLSTARQGYCFLPLIFLLPAIFGGTALTAVQAAADLLSLLVAAPLGIKAIMLFREKYKETSNAASISESAVTH